MNSQEPMDGEGGDEHGSTKITKVSCKGFKSFQRRTSIPFYEGLTAIVGENGNGKCVSGDTEVLLSDGSKQEIREIVEPALERSSERIDDGYIAYEGEEEIHVKSLNQETLEIEDRKILAYAKREAPDKVLEIETRSGRTITATKDHPLFVVEDGEVVAADAGKLKEGRRVATPRKIDVEPENTIFNGFIDALQKRDNLYAPYSQELEKKIRELKRNHGGTWEEFADSMNVPKSALKRLKDGQSINLYYVGNILENSKLKPKMVRELVKYFTAKKSGKKYRIPWSNSREFSRLLGYLIAEGQNPDSSGQIRFTNQNKEIIQNYENLMESVFEVKTHRKKYDDNCWDILVYSTPVKKFLEKFGFGKRSSQKTVTDLFLKNSGEKELCALIEGLYAGDGYVSWNAIQLTTKNQDLARSTQEIFTRLGIQSRVKEKEKTATNTGVTGTYYQVTVTGSNNVKKFRRKISIPHQEKTESVKQLSKRENNTNIDLIEANGTIQKTVEKLKIKPHSREKRSQTPKLGAYYDEDCVPSREGIKEVLSEIDADIEEADKLDKLAKSEIYWDEITSIQTKEPNYDWVYDLNIGVNHNFVANNMLVHNSNILDALSFVFGRRSSRLRAEKLEQLIFNGGESRKEADFAHCTVYLDNSSGIFDEFLEEKNEEEQDEITIGRKVTRAGSSMYKFMGTNCKRSFIERVAEKANIDPEGYHFVRQGKVTEIVEQSDTERREVIDELSGVKEFDEKKEEAEEELSEVQERLNEQQILLDEKKEYLEKLKEEKEVALKYRELEDRKKKIEASILEVRKRALSKRLADMNTDTAEREERVEELEEELEEIDTEIDEKKNRIEEIEEEQSQGDTDVQHLENRVEKKRGKIENKRDKIDDLEDTIQELEKMKNRGNTGSKAVDAVLSLDTDGIEGAFQDLISTEDRFAVAVETAAGGHMNDVVVENKQTAVDAINYLKRENIGRARMLPLDKIKDRNKSAKSQMALKKKGVIDYASNLVEYNEKYEKAMNNVFSDTLIAEDLDSVKDVDGVRVVTLDGDVMSRGGAMQGGKKKKSRGNKSNLSNNLSPDKKREEKKEIEEDIEELQRDIAELKEMKSRKKEDQQTDDELRDEKKQVREEMDEIREERQELYTEKEKLKSKIDEVGSKKAKTKAELENVKEDLTEYDLDEDELIGLDSTPEDLKTKKRKVLKKQNSMGPVNMRAIEEYKEKKEEFDDFKDKVSEIRQEKLEIEDMIEEIEQKKRKRFMDTLDEVNEDFSRIFTELFDGGEGELVLEDDNIEKGLKIRAAPPGKDPHIIDALSGGEKTMTAIAFVFSILEQREAPFYIMDEIDAALDKQNSKRLSEILKDYSDGNQFIVISHNDITVRHAERAYGVTMKDGVTKMRSIELEA